MSSREPVYIPRYIDAPPQFLFWQFDEVLPVGVAAIFCVLLHKTLVPLSIGVWISYSWMKYRDNHADGYALHMLYWSGLAPLSWVGKSHVLPDAMDREFLA